MSGRRQYPFDLIEPKWQAVWDQQQTFRAWNPGEVVPDAHPFARRHQITGKVAAENLPPKYYILDMFPYPSGAGLHVGHPEGYTATDILSRYRRATGFNVLHPMGWDAFGLPAEQYAIKTGQHPRVTTEANITTFKRQIKSLGFSYDWTREVDTTDPDYFKWTQWIFLKLYNSYFDPIWKRATPIALLEDALSDHPKNQSHWKENQFLLEKHKAYVSAQPHGREEERRRLIENSRLAYVSEAPVNWCPELGTVLANEEVIDGKSEVGGFPVIRKPMRQWMLRITAYAERLLHDLDTIEWSHSLKEMQRNWIGRSEGAEVDFEVVAAVYDRRTGADTAPLQKEKIRVFTTRPDTLFGATYMVLAPESKIVDSIVPANWPDNTPVSWRGSEFKPGGCDRPIDAIQLYRAKTSAKSDLERTVEDKTKEKTGVFTGAYAINPVNQEKIPIWIADYVLASYGTGAIMAVPAHDERDFEFARKFGLPVIMVVAPSPQPGTGGIDTNTKDWTHARCEEGVAINSPPRMPSWALTSESPEVSANARQTEAEYLEKYPYDPGMNGLPTAEAKRKITIWLQEEGLGKKTINYKLRDWLFSRQRYWGEPFPIIWKDGHHHALPESALPLLPPKLDDYKPTSDGQPPLARAQDWVKLPDGSVRETNTMPQWAGSCWYYLRYLDAHNDAAFVGKEVEHYWMGVASSLRPDKSAHSADTTKPGVDLYVGGTEHAVLHLLYARFWHKVLFDLGQVSTPEPFFKLVNQGLILGEDGQKMSKARGNVVNPDDMVREYGADALRLYEMFMGPLEMVKPWNTKGVEGVYRFLGKVWRLFVDEASETEFEQNLTAQPSAGGEHLAKIKLSAAIKDTPASPEQLKALHACIKKVTEDLDGLRFNTAISALMVFVNDAMKWEVKPRAVLRDFLTLLQPFAPHLAEELFAKLVAGDANAPATLAYEPWPKFDPALLVESTLEIPVQVNGKLRDVIQISAEASQDELQAAALASEKVKPFIEGKNIKKIIVIPGKLVNIAVN